VRVKWLASEDNTVPGQGTNPDRWFRRPAHQPRGDRAFKKRNTTLFINLLFVHIFFRDDERLTPLIQAAFCGCKLTTGLLLDQGAKIDATDKNGV